MDHEILNIHSTSQFCINSQSATDRREHVHNMNFRLVRNQVHGTFLSANETVPLVFIHSICKSDVSRKFGSVEPILSSSQPTLCIWTIMCRAWHTCAVELGHAAGSQSVGQTRPSPKSCHALFPGVATCSGQLNLHSYKESLTSSPASHLSSTIRARSHADLCSYCYQGGHTSHWKVV